MVKVPPDISSSESFPARARPAISVSSTDSSVTVVIAAERAETMDLLRRQADLLARELRASGYSEVNLRFDGGQNAGTGFGQDQDGKAGSGSPAAAATPAATPAPLASTRPLPPGQGLDLRL